MSKNETLGYAPNCEFEECWTLDRDYYTPQNLFYGSIGEQVVTSAVQLNYIERDGYHVKHNNFKDRKAYCTGKGMDITVQYKPEGYANVCTIEVKNLADQNKPYGTDFVRRHIVPRAKGTSGLKLLVITFFSLLTKQAVKLLENDNWLIVEVGERLTTQFYHELSKLYKLASKIKSAVKLFYDKLSSLPYYINSNNNNTTSQQSITLTHDTPMTSKPILSVNYQREHRKLIEILFCGHG